MPTYGYDAADQLTSEVKTGANAYSIAYAYDHNGNRTSKVLGGVTDTYSYDAHDKLLSTSSKTYAYDDNGNCLTVTVGGNTTTLTYDYENRVTGITYPSSATNSFAYNGLNLRMTKTDSGGTFDYVTDGTEPGSDVLGDGAAIYTPGLSERRGTTSKFYHGDALGSTRGITNSSETVTDTVLYDAFGMTVNRTGTTPTPFGFVGAEQCQSDADSGLTLVGNRYYDASVGRFISQDPSQDGDNWYAYCENNPLAKIDPRGLMTERDINNLKQIAKDNGWTFRKGAKHDIWTRGNHNERVPNNNKNSEEHVFKRVKKILESPPGAQGNSPITTGAPTVPSWSPPTLPAPNPFAPLPVQSPAPSGAITAGDIITDAGQLGERWVWIGGGIVIVGGIIVVSVTCAGACFGANTPVVMADGALKRIDQVHAGDKVLSRDERTGLLVAKSVTGVSITRTQNLVTLTFANGEKIVTTPNHLFYIPGKGFVPAEKIGEGTDCLLVSGQCLKATKVSRTRVESLLVYNLEVKDFHTYFVGNSPVWVHDITPMSGHRDK